MRQHDRLADRCYYYLVRICQEQRPAVHELILRCNPLTVECRIYFTLCKCPGFHDMRAGTPLHGSEETCNDTSPNGQAHRCHFSAGATAKYALRNMSQISMRMVAVLITRDPAAHNT